MPFRYIKVLPKSMSSGMQAEDSLAKDTRLRVVRVLCLN